MGLLDLLLAHDDDGDFEPAAGSESVEISDLGVEKHSLYLDGEWVTSWNDPGWDTVYDGDDMAIDCPECGADVLHYHNGQGCCITCDATFSDEEIEEMAGSWHL